MLKKNRVYQGRIASGLWAGLEEPPGKPWENLGEPWGRLGGFPWKLWNALGKTLWRILGFPKGNSLEDPPRIRVPREAS